ncbi:MAG: winged helix-turn-helix domain-containing protein, partial [Geminicoccaceae bacterium]|nr:winged helix-turn-helix domain-containing protein [Geminicoccaceae bacterium]
PKHAEIANCVNTHREAVSRTMSDLMRQGILRRGSGELIVLQVDRLRDLADH